MNLLIVFFILVVGLFAPPVDSPFDCIQDSVDNQLYLWGYNYPFNILTDSGKR